MNIYYDKSLKRDFMRSRNLGIDSSNYVVNKDTEKRIKDKNGQFIKANQFGGFKKGSVIFLTEDIKTILQEASQKTKLV